MGIVLGLGMILFFSLVGGVGRKGLLDKGLGLDIQVLGSGIIFGFWIRVWLGRNDLALGFCDVYKFRPGCSFSLAVAVMLEVKGGVGL